jgi:hypothetical protein
MIKPARSEAAKPKKSSSKRNGARSKEKRTQTVGRPDKNPGSDPGAPKRWVVQARLLLVKCPVRNAVGRVWAGGQGRASRGRVLAAGQERGGVGKL